MRRPSFLWAAICLSLAGTPAFAQATSSGAYTVSADETVSTAGIVTAKVDVGPIAPSSGAAPPSYNNSNSVLTLTESANLTTGIGGVTQGLQTGLLTSNANGTATAAEATATINDLSLSLGTNQFISSLLGLSATTIQSYSQANSIGGLDASGATLIEGLVLNGSAFGGITFDGRLFVNPNPNTVLFDAAGLSIILNEQSLLGDGLTSAGIITNAIHFGFDNFLLGTGLVNGDIIIGHSEALVSAGRGGAVPEPSTWAMMLIGFGAVGFALRRRNLEVGVPQRPERNVSLPVRFSPAGPAFFACQAFDDACNGWEADTPFNRLNGSAEGVLVGRALREPDRVPNEPLRRRSERLATPTTADRRKS